MIFLPLVNFLPTVGWFLFMVIGALHNLNIYYNYPLPAISIFTVFICFLISDTKCYCIAIKKEDSAKNSAQAIGCNTHKKTILFLLLISVLLLVLRMHLVGFDILELIIRHREKLSITQARVALLNNSGSRHILFILQNIGFVFIFPITALCLRMSTEKLLNLLFIPFIVVISISSIMGGERFPFFSFITPIIICLLCTSSLNQYKRLVSIVLVPMLIVCLTMVNARISSYSSLATCSDRFLAPLDRSNISLRYANFLPRKAYFDLLDSNTKADHSLRSMHPVDDLIRRMMLIPSDVSYHYFRIFPTLLPHSYSFGLYRSINELRGMTISNIAGNIIYRAKYPTKYLSQVSAYSSFDSDAYARFGPLGLITSVLLLISFRLLCAICTNSDDISKLVYLCIVSSLFWLPSIASIQAMLISQGYLFALLILLKRGINARNYVDS